MTDNSHLGSLYLTFVGNYWYVFFKTSMTFLLLIMNYECHKF